MKERQAEEKSIGVIGSLAAGATQDIGFIHPEGSRTLAITCQVTYNASATSGITVKIYYNHEKIGVDTVEFASFVPTLSAGSIVQRTVLIDCPEGGTLLVKVKNDDGTYTATKITVGYSLMRWVD